jgi:NAD(P)-dependent dehydrogenase (short-subunit alcohol dehydrogenase family)
MTGKTVAITGSTSGTCYVFARELGRAGATVLLLNRPSPRAQSALASLIDTVPTATFVAIDCDLQDLASVQNAAQTITQSYQQLDVLCNNAGVMALEDTATKDGFDVQMQTNAMAHFLLTKELFGLLKRSPDARIINQTSMARLGAPLDQAYFAKNGGNLGGNGTDQEAQSFSGPRWERYHQSKLANCAFTYGLQEKLEQAGISNIKALLAHPGLALTSLQATTAESGGMDANSPFMTQAQSAEDGAAGIIRAAVDPKAASGDFYGPQEWTGFPNALPPEELLTSRETIDTNWQGCEAAVGGFAI